jgi:hypothetical protein
VARWTASLHPRGKGGKFKKKSGGVSRSSARRGKKIKKLQAKNNRIVKQYSKDKDLHGTPLGSQIENRIIRRAIKINRLKSKQSAMVRRS